MKSKKIGENLGIKDKYLCFISCSFNDRDKDVVNHYVELIESHNLKTWIAKWPEPRTVSKKVLSHLFGTFPPPSR